MAETGQKKTKQPGPVPDFVDDEKTTERHLTSDPTELGDARERGRETQAPAEPDARPSTQRRRSDSV